jgi:uncharacterized phosphosugar-binding protein
MLDSTVMTSEGARRSAEIERIPGIAKIIWDQHKIHPEDLFIIISNSGRNAMPLEMAMLANENRKQSDRHHITLEQSANYPSRHPSGKKLMDVADIVLDNRVPSGDGLIHIGGNLTGPVSSMAGIFLVNLLATEGMKKAASGRC